jgi:hypothetical protein
MLRPQIEKREADGKLQNSTKGPIPNLILTDSEIRESRRFVEELLKGKEIKESALHQTDVKV